MIYCPICGKSRDHHNTNTLTTSNSVWPYCQCSIFPATLITLGDTPYTGWISLKQQEQVDVPLPDSILSPSDALKDYMAKYPQWLPVKIAVPQAFQDAFKDGELEI